MLKGGGALPPKRAGANSVFDLFSAAGHFIRSLHDAPRRGVPQPLECEPSPLDCRVLQFSPEPRPCVSGDSTGAPLTARLSFAPWWTARGGHCDGGAW